MSSPLRRLHLGDCRTRRASAPNALPRTTLRTKTRRLNPPPGAVSDPRARPTAPPKDFALGRAQHNESRLSCSALVKDSFHTLRALSASSACYAGAQPISNSLSSPLRRLGRGYYRSFSSPELSALPCTTLRSRTRRLNQTPSVLSILKLALVHQPKVLL